MSTIPRQTVEIDPLALISSYPENSIQDQSAKIEKPPLLPNDEGTSFNNSTVDSLEASVHEFLLKCR
jgi:hypothetical protein